MRLPKRTIWWGVVVALVLGALAWMVPARALLGSVSMEPVEDTTGAKRNVFDLIVKEGETINDAFYVQNTSSESVRVFMFPSGFELQGDKVVQVQLPVDAPEEPGTWITIATSDMVLPPSTRRKIGFTIHVFNQADVGDHMATVFVQAIPLKTPTQGSGVSINVRSGVRVYMTVPGTIDRTLKVSKITHRVFPFWKLFTKKMAFAITFDNGGNVTLKPTIDITVQGLFGRVGRQEAAQYVKIGRGQTQTGEKEWIRRAPYFGRFVAHFDIHLGEREQVDEDGSKTMLPDEVLTARYVFWIFPWTELLVLLIIIFILHLLRSAWLYWIIVQRMRIKTKVYTVAKGDTLMKVSSKLGIDPRVLAKFNLVRWPYELRPGDKLLVPVGKHTGAEWRISHSSLFTDREFWLTIFGHLFKRKTPQLLADQASGRGITGSKVREFTTLVADKGDTIGDVADFAGISVRELAKHNSLKPPYILKAGQELRIPKAKLPGRKR